MGGTTNWLDDAMKPTEEDSADVRWAIETAVALWHRGDREQSLSWMHHAVQAATADGRHARADELDRAAQELETRPVPRPASRPPPGPGAPSPLGVSPPARSPGAEEGSSGTTSKQQRARTAPYRLAPDDITHLEAPASALLEAAAQSSDTGPTEPVNEAPAPPPKAKPERPRPPLSSDPIEATVVNAGVKRRQERTMVMDMGALMREAQEGPSPLGMPHAFTTPGRREGGRNRRTPTRGWQAGSSQGSSHRDFASLGGPPARPAACPSFRRC